MRTFIIGGGRTGSVLAGILKENGISPVIIEKNPEVVEKLCKRGFEVYKADACDPVQLSKTEISGADVCAVVTGHDEDNLVISHLLKRIFNVRRVIARVNHPLNEWLYDESWGVDIAVSATHIISELLFEEIESGRIIELLRIRQGKIGIVEMKIDESSKVAGKALREISLPEGSLIVTVLRDNEIIVPSGSLVLTPGDEILAIVRSEVEKELITALT